MTELLQMLKKRKYSEKNTIISQCTLGVDKIIPTVLCFIQQPAAETVVTGSKGALPVTLRRQPAAETVVTGSTASDPTTACSRDCGHRQQGSTASDPTTACSRDYGHRQHCQ